VIVVQIWHENSKAHDKLRIEHYTGNDLSVYGGTLADGYVGMLMLVSGRSTLTLPKSLLIDSGLYYPEAAGRDRVSPHLPASAIRLINQLHYTFPPRSVDPHCHRHLGRPDVSTSSKSYSCLNSADTTS
jgi:hypothetical protein